MNVKVISLDHFCTQKEGQDCGEVLKQFDGSQFVRKYIFAGQKMPKLFLTRQAAEEEAKILGYTVNP